MQVLGRAAVALALALPLAATQLSAQRYHWDASLNGGPTWLSGDLLKPRGFDIFDDDIFVDNVAFDDIGFGNSWLGSAQLGYWFNSRIGLRANFTYTAANLDQGSGDLFSDVNVWGGTGDLLVRLAKPRERWSGMEWLPYIAGGLGATWINPPGDHFFMIQDLVDFDPFDDRRGDGKSGIPITCAALVGLGCFVGIVDDDFDDDFNTFFLAETSRFTGLLAIGTDVRFSPRWAIRLEAGDRIWSAPMYEVEPIFTDGIIADRTVIEIAKSSHTINQFYLTAGVNFLFGLESPPKKVVVAPPPRPAPPPPPRTEEITVCVVDLSYAGGLRNITATHHLSNGDTTVTKNGTTMRLSEAYGNVPVASSAPWYVSGAPFEIGTAPNRMLYNTVGAARMIDAADLAFLGTANGIPVFADRMTLAPGLTNLGPNTDLNRLVSESADARKALDTVSVIYVPLQSTGCVFQALQKQQEVKKGEQQ